MDLDYFPKLQQTFIFQVFNEKFLKIVRKHKNLFFRFFVVYKKNILRVYDALDSNRFILLIETTFQPSRKHFSKILIQ